MSRSLSFLLSVLLLFILNFGCGGSLSQSLKANAVIQSSFGISQNTLAHESVLKLDKAFITIKKSALEKEFLLQPLLLDQVEAPEFNSLQSRIVYFKEKNARLYLMQSTDGHTISKDLPQNLLLTEFPVISQTSEEIVFDFNTGMSQIFIGSDWHTHDDDIVEYEKNFKTIKIAQSYIDDAKFAGTNKLIISQIAKIDNQVNNRNTLTYKIVYYLTPYLPDPQFNPTVYADYDEMGFFETAPLLNLKGGAKAFATKFNIQKPIVFAVSANTPAEYKNAVKEGALYWNKAFGRNVVKVIDAPQGVSAPEYKYNIIQWINDDDAGYAYADAQIDPRTGEIYHAQIYLTSVFAFNSKWKTLRLIKQLSNNKNRPSAIAHKSISIAGFESPHRYCHFKLNKSHLAQLSEVVSLNINDSADVYLKVSQSYVRDVVAHEVGHTLGLRHNFAASLATNLKLEDKNTVIKNYLSTFEVPSNLVITSSVMDYLPFQESIISGHQLLTNKTAHEYDQKAIESLYFNKTYNKNELPLFCTDSHVEAKAYADCNKNDSGSSVAEYVKHNFDTNTQILPYMLFNLYLASKTEVFQQKPTPIEKIILDPQSWAHRVFEDRELLLKLLTKNGNLLKINRQFPQESYIYEDKIKAHKLEFLSKDISNHGGLAAILKPINPQLSEQLKSKLNWILTNPDFTSGIGPDKKPYKFSESELTFIKQNAELFFNKLQDELYKEDIKSLKGIISSAANEDESSKKKQDSEANQLLVEHPLSKEYLNIIISRMSDYVLSVQGETEATVKMEEKEKNEKNESEKSLRSELNSDVNLFEIDSTHTPVFSRNRDKKEEADKLYKKKERKFKTLQVKIPQFKYKYSLRYDAAGLAKIFEYGPTLDWGLSEKTKITEEFEDLLKRSLNTSSLDNYKASDLDAMTARWFLENQKILGQFK